MTFQYEKKDLSLPSFTLIALISVALLLIIIFGSIQYFNWQKESVYFTNVLEPVSKKLTALRQHEEEVLSTYGIVDAKNSVYRIPIEKAIELSLKK